jgi:hypothetical protein
LRDSVGRGREQERESSGEIVDEITPSRSARLRRRPRDQGEEYGQQHEVPEQGEQEQIARDEHARHRAQQHQHLGDEIARARQARGQDRAAGTERQQQHEPIARAAQTHVKARGEGPLQPDVRFIRNAVAERGHDERGERDDGARPLGRRLGRTRQREQQQPEQDRHDNEPRDDHFAAPSVAKYAMNAAAAITIVSA